MTYFSIIKANCEIYKYLNEPNVDHFFSLVLQLLVKDLYFAIFSIFIHRKKIIIAHDRFM